MSAPRATEPPAPGPLEPILLGGSINLLAGSSGAGKTALFAMLARCLQDGDPVFGLQPPEPAPYLAYVGLDKSWVRSSSKWFALENVALKHYAVSDDKTFRKKRFRTKNDRTAIFHEFLKRVSPDAQSFPPGSVVFFDPIALFLGGNLLDYDAAAVACLELREVAQEMNHVCVVGAVHGIKMKSDKKQGYARLQDNILGSAALFGYSDTQMYLASAEELKQPHALLQITPHHAPAQTWELSRDAEGRYLFEREVGHRPAPKVAQVEEWVKKTLADAPDRTLDFAALLQAGSARGVNRRTLFRVVQVGLSGGWLRRQARGRYLLVLPA